jgi:hypothetical protein
MAERFIALIAVARESRTRKIRVPSEEASAPSGPLRRPFRLELRTPLALWAPTSGSGERRPFIRLPQHHTHTNSSNTPQPVSTCHDRLLLRFCYRSISPKTARTSVEFVVQRFYATPAANDCALITPFRYVTAWYDDRTQVSISYSGSAP